MCDIPANTFCRWALCSLCQWNERLTTDYQPRQASGAHSHWYQPPWSCLLTWPGGRRTLNSAWTQQAMVSLRHQVTKYGHPPLTPTGSFFLLISFPRPVCSTLLHHLSTFLSPHSPSPVQVSALQESGNTWPLMRGVERQETHGALSFARFPNVTAIGHEDHVTGWCVSSLLRSDTTLAPHSCWVSPQSLLPFSQFHFIL